MTTTFYRLVDLFVDRIILFTDYFILKKHVTLSETALFAFSASWALWFTVFGVNIASADQDAGIRQTMWCGLFVGTSVFHFGSFFLKRITGRIIAVCVYGVTWCGLALLSGAAGSTGPAVPTLIVLTLLSVFVAVRLIRERKPIVSQTVAATG